MNDLKAIRNYYKPIQPTVKADNNIIVYQETKPGKAIENFVYCFWQLKTFQTLKTPFIYRVVSDGCIDIFFDHNRPIDNYIMGFCRKYTAFPIGKEFDYIGIRFLPSALPLLFGINAKKLSNQSQELIHILPNFSKWIKNELTINLSYESIIALLNHKLETLIEPQKFDFDARFYKALKMIFQKKGFLDIEKDLDTGLSPRQLRRIFNFYIGTTPKAFSNVVRFQNILNAEPSIRSLKEDKLYFDLGFFDQAHFIKTFKTFYGLTPSEAFQ